MPIRSAQNGAAPTRFPSRFARFGDFELDIQRQELFRSGIRIKLQSKVYEALLVLLETPREIISRELIRQRLWPGDSLVNFDANVNTTVNKLRQVLGDSPEAPSYVETIPRKGYCFVAEVAFADAPRETAGVQGTAQPAGLLGIHSAKWLAAAFVVLGLSAILFGAAIMLYIERGR
jgi:DNA-binding winged helix-turn-helix (wHTH) protein